MKPVKLFIFTGFSCSWDLWPHPDISKLICNLTLPYHRTDFEKERVMKAWLMGDWGWGKQRPENDASKICIQNCIMTWIRVLFALVFMRIVWIWPRIWTSSSNCWAPNSPGIVGLSHVFGRIGNGGSSGRRRSSGGVFTTHEINAWQGVCWSGEGKATVEITWPNGTAEWSGGPQATGVAQDWL